MKNYSDDIVTPAQLAANQKELIATTDKNSKLIYIGLGVQVIGMCILGYGIFLLN